jgi:hypothetical protein
MKTIDRTHKTVKTDKQTNRQTDKQTKRQRDKETKRQRDKETKRQTDKHVGNINKPQQDNTPAGFEPSI